MVIFLSSDASEESSPLGLSVFTSGAVCAAGAVCGFAVFFLAGAFSASFGSVSAGAAAASVKSVEISESVCDKFPVSWANLWVDKVVIMSDFLSFSVVEFQCNVELLGSLDLLDHSLRELVTEDPDLLAVRKELKSHVHAIGSIHDAVVVQECREIQMRCDRQATVNVSHAAVLLDPLRVLLLLPSIRGTDVNHLHLSGSFLRPGMV